MRTIEELPLHDGYITDRMTGFEHFLKRTMDLFIAVVCIIVFTPLFLLCYLAIKLEDGGPAIFSQERIGKSGKPFNIYKFRSMKDNTENDGIPLLTDTDSGPNITKVGRFIRAHHIDELPQLWNVVKGDMAFIGYRPERQYFINKIMEQDERYAYLYQIRPGVTSYATLYNGYTDTIEKMLCRLHYDLYYLEHQSFKFDCKILWRTFFCIVSGKKF